MSIETFRLEHKHFSVDEMHGAYVAWLACSVESEAQIAALKSERDALREALSKLTRECFGSMGLEPELMRQLWGNTNVNILEQRIAEARALLSTPASGEPARKP